MDIPEQPVPSEIPEQPPIVSPEQSQGHQESRILGDDRPQGYAFYLHAEAVDQRQRGQDIDDVLSDGDHHRDARVLHADIPAGETIQPQYRRCAPNDDVEIDGGAGHHVIRRSYQPEHQPLQRHLQHDEQ